MTADTTPDRPVDDLADREEPAPSATRAGTDPALKDGKAADDGQGDTARPVTEGRQGAEGRQEAEEPAWIEVGSPKRRSMPPSWSDEAVGDAWQPQPTTEQPSTSTKQAPIELMDHDPQPGAAPADGPNHDGWSDEGSSDEVPSGEGAVRPEGAEPATAAEGPAPEEPAAEEWGAAEEPAVEEPAAEERGSAVMPPATAEPAISQGSPALRGVRLRKPPRVTHNRPFRRPAVRDAARGEDPWVQGPMDEAGTPGTDEDRAPAGTPVEGPDATSPEAQAGLPTEDLVIDPDAAPAVDPTEPTAAAPAEAPAVDAAEDPESGGRWTVVPEPAGADADQGEPAGVPPPAAPGQHAEHESRVAQATGTDHERTHPQDPAPPAPDPSGPPAQGADPQEHTDRQEGTDPPEHTGREGAGTLSGALDVVSEHLRPHRSALITGLTALLLSVWTLVALPFPLKYAVDAAMATAGAQMPALDGSGPGSVQSLLIAAGVLVVLVALQTGFRALSVTALNRAGGGVATALRARLLSHLHRLSPGRDIDDLDRTVPPLVDDVARLRDLVSHTGPRLATSLLALASLLVVVVVVEPIAALIVLVTGGMYALVARLTTSWQRSRRALAVAEEAALTATAEELLAATRTIQSYGLEDRAEKGLTEVGERAERARSSARRAEVTGRVAAELIAGAGVALALLVGGWRMSAGTMTPGEMTLVIAYVLIAVVLVRELVGTAVTLRATIASGDRVGELLAHRAAITDPGRTQPLDRVRGEIVFSAISAPGPHDLLLDTVSLVIPAGQHAVLLDREGLETSALLSYLLRFDEPETGRVLLDRYDTRAVPLADLRRQLALVQREPALLTETVRENIRIGRPDADDDEIVEAARRSGADEFITLLPEGYDTPLTRRGAGLTDGQRRRIAITRALLRDAPVVILDGADADLAPTERDAVHRALDALMSGRTALITSRDPESILDADRLLCFERGALAEDGDPHRLAEDPDSWLATWIHAADDTGR